jgi:hypothetical protein
LFGLSRQVKPVKIDGTRQSLAPTKGLPLNPLKGALESTYSLLCAPAKAPFRGFGGDSGKDNREFKICNEKNDFLKISCLYLRHFIPKLSLTPLHPSKSPLKGRLGEVRFSR